MTSKVMAVPKSTTMHGPPYLWNAATPLTMRSAPTSSGIVDEHGHACFHAGFDEQRFLTEVDARHFRQRPIHRRHDRTDNHAANRGAVESGNREEVARQHAVFIDGLNARGGQAPVRDEFVVAKDAEHRVRVANIDGE